LFGVALVNMANVFKELIIAQSIVMLKFRKNAQNELVSLAQFYIKQYYHASMHHTK
jgi:hypothetical protein